MLKYIYITAFLLLANYSIAQQYNFIQYSISEGLAQSQVYSMVQDSKGYLWFGTQGGGLSRFDGKEFDNFSTKDGLSSNAISCIFEDSKKHIWVGTKRGLSKYDGKEFKEIKWNNNIIPRIETFLQKNDSTLWIGTRKGILEYSFSSDSIYEKKIHPVLDKNIVHKLYQGKKGIWVGTIKGAYHLGEKITLFNTGNGLSGNEVLDFTEGNDGLIWMISHEGGLEFVDENTLEIIRKKNIPNTKDAWCIQKDNDGNIWIGREEKGLVFYHAQDSVWTNISTREGLPNKNIISILQDDWGNIWFATSGGGVLKYLGQFFIHYDESEGVHGDRIYAINENENGDILFSASSEGLAIYDSLGFHATELDSGYLDVKCKSILEKKDGSFWLGTIGKGIFISDTTGVKILNEENGFQGKEVLSMVEDDRGYVWAATNHQGIFRIEDLDTLGFSILNFNRKDGLRSLRITQMKMGPNKNIWFATKLGEVGYIENDKIIKIFREEEGLTYDNAVRSIAFDNIGNIWVGTAGDGILKAELTKDSIQFNPITLRDELHSFNIYLLIFDKEGNLWAGNEKGVDKLTINETGIVTDIQFFGKNKGFLGIETCQNSAICDKDGNIWFGTLNGLTQHIPSKQQIKISPPQIHFKEVSLFYQPLSETRFSEFVNPLGGIKEGLKLPYHTNSVNFEFKAINISNPDDIRYRWKLEGAENEWSPFSKKESVDYSNLPSGEYTFAVQAISGKELLSESISSSFEIKEPFWQTIWFKLLILLLFALIFGSILWTWKRRIQFREKIKRDKLEIENHVLQLEQKALQLQMNPHFIFNALNSIQSLVATKDYTTARKEIGNFASLMRGILSNSRKNRINLEEEINTLDKYLKMEQFCQRVKFDYFIIPPNNMDAEEIEIPPMLLQPFVENSVIHGISHLEKDGEIKVEFKVYQKILECVITDNGVGRKKANELRQSKKPGHQSVAMEVTKDRLDALKGNLNYKPLEMSDILDKNGNVEGTKVVVRLPLEVDF